MCPYQPGNPDTKKRGTNNIKLTLGAGSSWRWHVTRLRLPAHYIDTEATPTAVLAVFAAILQAGLLLQSFALYMAQQ